MKNRFFFLFWLLGLPGELLAQNIIYTDKILPNGYTIASMSVVREGIIWMVASAAKGDTSGRPIKVLRTLDRGASWEMFDVPEAKGSRSVDIVGRSASEAWITVKSRRTGSVSGLCKTADGGKSWSWVLRHGTGDGFLRFFDKQHIQTQSISTFLSGHSGDGGLTWQIDTLPHQKGEYLANCSGNNMASVAGDTLWAGTSQGRIMRCTNYGENCKFLPCSGLPKDSEIFSIAFNDHLNGLLFFFIEDAGKLAKTSDGGLTWEVLENAPKILSTCYLEPMPRAGPRAFWALSNTGSTTTLGYTTDSGYSWDLQTIPGMPATLQCGSDGTLWIVLQEDIRDYQENHLINNYKHYVAGTYIWGIDFYTLAFTIIEESHAISLLQGKINAEAMHQSGLPTEMIQREKKLRDSINYLEKQLIHLEKNTAKQEISIQTKSINRQYNELIHQMEVTYPSFLRNRNDIRIAYLQEVQQELLPPGQALIEYFITDSIIFIGLIENNKLRYYYVKKDFPLEQWVAELRSSLSAFHTDPAMASRYDSLAAAYTGVAHQLYEKLLAPIADSLPEHLIILPDGVLSYLPFEVSLTAAPTAAPNRWQDHPYLLKKHSISYAYSATMLREMTVHPHLHEPKVNFYGFAPRYEGSTALLDSLFPDTDLRKDLQPLPYTGEEVYKAAKLMDGAYFTGQEASEATFRAKASEARILHLATHGRANHTTGDYSFLVFAEQKDGLENEILYARDIYNLQLNADLVTLSACETGLGELQDSEGIISLARAFAYAGAKSIVTSLWSVSDAKTKDLMVDFYKNLRKGMLKDDALRQAKLDFLKRNKGQAAHPFYWAGFVGIGNMGKVK